MDNQGIVLGLGGILEYSIGGWGGLGERNEHFNGADEVGGLYLGVRVGVRPVCQYFIFDGGFKREGLGILAQWDLWLV